MRRILNIGNSDFTTRFSWHVRGELEQNQVWANGRTKDAWSGEPAEHACTIGHGQPLVL